MSEEQKKSTPKKPSFGKALIVSFIVIMGILGLLALFEDNTNNDSPTSVNTQNTNQQAEVSQKQIEIFI